MKYTIFGFQQLRLIDEGLDFKEALLLERLNFFAGYMEKREIVDGKQYSWIAYSKIQEEIPMALSGSTDKLTRYLLSLEKKGFIKRMYKKGNNITKVFFYIVPDRFELLCKPLEVTTQECVDTGNTAKMLCLVTPQNCESGNTAKLRNESSGIESSGKEIVSTFQKPTLAEIKEYILLKNYKVTAEDFLNYYEESNWKDRDGRKVKNWKLKLLTWNSYNKNTTVNNFTVKVPNYPRAGEALK
jgi:hypothetical protein